MLSNGAARVRIAGPSAEARRLAQRLSRAGIPTAPDDGSARAEVLVALASGGLAHLRQRAHRLIAVGFPAAPKFAAGADDVVGAGEPEVLFRCVRAAIERADLEARVERLSARLKALEEGLAEAAHDLRSPLHTCIGHAELLTKDPKLNASQRKSAEAAARQATRAVELAERILEGAGRPDSAALQVRGFQLQALLEGALASAQSAVKEKDVRLLLSPLSRPMVLRGDTDLLARLLDNLLANAIRHTPSGGEVELSALRASPQAVRLCVRDTGLGIASADLPRLLAGLGTGRGLRICREIAERHGGELWAQSVPGKGSRFFVDLPIDLPAFRPHVLLVSDHAGWLRDAQAALQKSCVLSLVGTAKARLGAGHTDLVLVEVPAKGRVPALSAVRNAAKQARVPVIDLPSTMGAGELARALFRLTA